jgi:hypothetical protein
VEGRAPGGGSGIATVEFLHEFGMAEFGLGVGFQSTGVFVVELSLNAAVEDLDLGVVQYKEVGGKLFCGSESAVHDVSSGCGAGRGGGCRLWDEDVKEVNSGSGSLGQDECVGVHVSGSGDVDGRTA